MDNKELFEYVDQHRWLLNNGLVSDNVKNQLFFYGSIVHKDVKAVDLKIKPENKTIEYTIFVDGSLSKKIDKYKKLSTSKSLFDMWRFKRLLKKEGSLDFQRMLSNFVSDFCGPKWITIVAISDFDTYIDKVGDEGGIDGSDQEYNKLSDHR